MIITEPGIYNDISIEDYHASRGISNSGISALLKTPKTYWYNYIKAKQQNIAADAETTGEEHQDSKRSLVIGNAFHTLALEEKTFIDRYCVPPKFDRRTKDGKADSAMYWAQNFGKIALTEKEHTGIFEMAKAFREHPIYAQVKDAVIECSFATNIDHVLVRSRPDFHTDNYIFDIKTTNDASEYGFAGTIRKYGYHRQAAIACDCLTELTGRNYSTVILIAIEKTPPYLIAVYVIDGASLERGRSQYREVLQLYKKCLEKNEWPGYPEQVQSISIPYWDL